MPSDRHEVRVGGWYVEDATGKRTQCRGADYDIVKVLHASGVGGRYVTRDAFASGFTYVPNEQTGGSE